MTTTAASTTDDVNYLALGAAAVLWFTGASRRSMFWTCLAISAAPLLYRGVQKVLVEGRTAEPDHVGYDDSTSRAIAAQNPSPSRVSRS